MGTMEDDKNSGEIAISALLNIYRLALGLKDTEVSSEGNRRDGNQPFPQFESRVPEAEFFAEKTLYFDVTLAKYFSRTSSIERVIHILLKELKVSGINLILINFDGDRWRMQEDETVFAPVKDSHYLGAEFNFRLPKQAFYQLEELRRKDNLHISFVVYDVFLMTHPHWYKGEEVLHFAEWLAFVYRCADQVLTNSYAVEGQVRAIADLASWQVSRGKREIRYGVFSLGYDSASYFLETAKSQRHHIDITPLGEGAVFLTVAMLQYRKGILPLLDTFSSLWKRKFDVKLAIAGKVVSREIHNKICQHAEYGTRLFFYEYPSDKDVSSIANRSTALIVPSLSEGYGLPVAESCQWNLPVIARDLAVFREIAGDTPLYYDNNQTHSLEGCIEDVLLMEQRQLERFQLRKTQLVSWRQSVQQLMRCILLTGQ